MELENKILQAIKDDELYGFIANHYYEISKEKIEDLIKTIDVNKYGARGIKRGVKKYISNLIKEEKLTRT